MLRIVSRVEEKDCGIYLQKCTHCTAPGSNCPETAFTSVRNSLFMSLAPKSNTTGEPSKTPSPSTKYLDVQFSNRCKIRICHARNGRVVVKSQQHKLAGLAKTECSPENPVPLKFAIAKKSHKSPPPQEAPEQNQELQGKNDRNTQRKRHLKPNAFLSLSLMP